MLDLKDYGIEMWDESKIASFRRTLMTWYDQEKEIYLGVERATPTTSGLAKSCCNRLRLSL